MLALVLQIYSKILAKSAYLPKNECKNLYHGKVYRGETTSLTKLNS